MNDLAMSSDSIPLENRGPSINRFLPAPSHKQGPAKSSELDHPFGFERGSINHDKTRRKRNCQNAGENVAKLKEN
jgi:hypothetical protein